MALLNRKNLERAIIVAVALAAAAPFVGEPLGVEYSLMDFRFAVNRGASDPEEVHSVAVLLADTGSEQRLGRPYDSSWREFYPDLLATLRAAGARAVVWDVAFAATEPEFDGALAEALQDDLPVIVGEDRASLTTPALAGAFTHVGWLPLVGSGAIPRFVPVADDPPPISWIASRYLADPVPEIGPAPEDPAWIDYSRNIDDLASYSIADVLLSDGTRLANELRTPLSVFRDRVVFIGLSLPATDRYALPGTRGARVPGVYAQVTAALTFVQDQQIRRLPPLLNWAIAAAVALGLTIVWTLPQRIPRRIATIVVVVAGLFLPVVLFSAWRVLVSQTATLIAVLVPLAGVGVARRLWLTKSYRTSLGFDPELIQGHRDLIESFATGVEREAVVLCSDVRNYTQFVTDHKPDEVQRVMSEYMAAMESVVDAHGGYVNKYVGDEIVAVFGFPRNEKGTIDRAVKAGLAMLRKLDELNEKWTAEGLPPLEAVGIGLDAGPLRFTHIGGRHRVQFDIIGNPINGASRLQTLTKEHKRPLILPAEIVEVQQELDVTMYGAPEEETHGKAVSFLGEVMVRGQGRRRVYGLT
jgi:class 3 adenylate cyclase/CHASE2 domain-containing sensor protein